MYHAQPRLTNITFVAVTETTGLFPMMHRLVEVGAVRFQLDSREIATFQQLINPHIPIPPEVQRVHGITDAMVQGKPTVERVLPEFIEFLGAPNTLLLAYNASFDLGFLALALIRFGIVYPPHDAFDTLDIARRLYPTWLSRSLEHMATRLNVANGAAHRALSDARLVKDVFLAVLRRTPTLKTIADLAHLWPLLTFADAPVCAIHPPLGFEALAMAMTERCAIMIVYEHGWQQPTPRMITPRLVLEVQGVAYLIAHCHLSDAERTFRLDRIWECWLEEEAGNPWIMDPPGTMQGRILHRAAITGYLALC
jgi:DNA polymerase III epsilon subunit family exonuclease